MRRLLPLLVALVLPAELPAQQQHCAPATLPDRLPMVMQLVDSMALATALPRAVLPPTTFSLWYGPNGQLTHAMALQDSLVGRHEAQPDSGVLARAQLATLLGGVAFPVDSGKEMTVRLTIGRDSTGAVSLAVARSVVCYPQAVKRGGLPQRMMLMGSDVTELERAGPISASVVIDAAGRARDVQIIKSSGTTAYDEMERHELESRTWLPETVDGFGKAVVLQMELQAPRFTAGTPLRTMKIQPRGAP